MRILHFYCFPPIRMRFASGIPNPGCRLDFTLIRSLDCKKKSYSNLESRSMNVSKLGPRKFNLIG